MQRRFSTFPDEWPGRGLLLLRLAVAAPLFYWAIGDRSPYADGVRMLLDWTAAVLGLLIVAGLWTPAAGVLISIAQAVIAASFHFAPQGHVLVAALGLCLAMLGPGAWSVDARLFGRRVFRAGDDDL